MGPVRQNSIQRTVRSIHVCVCIALCTTVVRNIAQNRRDDFLSYPPDNSVTGCGALLCRPASSASSYGRTRPTSAKSGQLLPPTSLWDLYIWRPQWRRGSWNTPKPKHWLTSPCTWNMPLVK